MKEQEIKKIVDLGEGIERQAQMVTSYKDALDSLFKQLADETAKNTREAQRMWKKASEILNEKYPEESELNLSFNHRLGKFTINQEVENDYRERP